MEKLTIKRKEKGEHTCPEVLIKLSELIKRSLHFGNIIIIYFSTFFLVKRVYLKIKTNNNEKIAEYFRQPGLVKAMSNVNSGCRACQVRVRKIKVRSARSSEVSGDSVLLFIYAMGFIRMKP